MELAYQSGAGRVKEVIPIDQAIAETGRSFSFCEMALFRLTTGQCSSN
jgi:hypothetical protein